MRHRLIRTGIACALGGIISAGCETKAGSGALIGGAAGAGAGAIIGHQSGHTGAGAVIGGAAGAVGGALIGNEMDKKDDREAREREQQRQQVESSRSYDNSRSRYDSGASQITKADVINWTARGTRDDIIIDRIQRSGTVFQLTAQDERDLRDEGVSPEVILAMKDTQRTSSSAR